MNINPTSQTPATASSPPSAPLPGQGSTPDNPKEAAEQFEKIFAKQFVQVMTKQMFSSGLSGNEGAQWMKSQRRRQRSIMANVLTDHLVDSGGIGLRDRLLEQWNVSTGEDASGPSAQAASELKKMPARRSPALASPVLQSAPDTQLDTGLQADKPFPNPDAEE